MAKHDDILKKYGITQVTGSEDEEKNKDSESAKSNESQTVQSSGTGSNKADAILAKYGITQVRQSSADAVEEWANGVNYLLSSANSYYSKWHSKEDEGHNNFRSRFYNYLTQADYWREQYSDNEDAIAYIDSVVSALKEGSNSVNSYFKYYSQWDSEDKYTEYLNNQKAYEEMVNFDLDAGQKELEELEAIKQEYNSWRYLTGPEVQAKYREFAATYGDIKNLDAMISEKTSYLNQAKRTQEGIALSGAVENADFDKYNDYASTESNNWWSKLTSRYGMGYDDLTYEYINGGQNGMRSEILDKAIAFGADNSLDATDKWTVYDNMTEDEISIYNYYYAKEGKEAADKYLDSIQETLNHREGASMFANMEDNTLLELAFGVAAGLDQFESGMKGAWNAVTGKDDYIPTSSTQYASGMVREDLADAGPQLPDWMGGSSLGQVGYDAITTTSNMAPSILASIAVGTVSKTAGAYVGRALMGTSAAGNAYQQKLNMGYTQEQARAYGVMVGASEVLLESLLGGISQMGTGMLPDAVIKNLTAVDNVLGKVAASAGGQLLIHAGSEAIEEGLQEILEPYLWQAVSGEEATVEWEQALYSSLLGFITGGVFEGGNVAVNAAVTNANYRATGKEIMGNEGGVDALMQLANEVAGVSEGSVQKNLTKQTGKVGNHATARNVGRLYDTVQNANNTANASANQADIVKSLERNGFATDQANDIAAALVAKYNGQELTSAQQKLLKTVSTNSDVMDAISGIMLNSKSTMGQRSQNIRTFRESYLSDASRTNPAQQGQANATASDKVDAQNKNGTESHYEVSADGKAIDKAGNDVKIIGIESIGNGKMVLKTENGTIDSSEVLYASKEEALVYEAVARLDASPASAWAMIKGWDQSSGVSAQEYATDLKLAYTYGKLNYTAGIKKLNAKAATAFQMGRSDAAAAVKATENASTESTVSDKNAGKQIIFEGFTYSKRKANDVQKASMEAADIINKMSNLEVHVYKSYKKSDGKLYAMLNGKERLAPNGYFTDGNKIYIDFNSGNKGEGVMLYTMSHEISHYIAKWNAQDFKAISDFLFEHYGENVPIMDLLEKEKNKLKNKYEQEGKPIPSEAFLDKKAHEELVCDMLARMMADKNAYDKLMELKQKDLKLHQKLGQAIKKVLDKLAKIIGVYDSKNPDFLYAASVETFGEEAFRQLQDLYMKAFVQADANFQSAEKNTTEDGGVDIESMEQRSDRIVDQIRNSLDDIMALDSVYTIDASNATPYTSVWKTDEKSGAAVFKAQGGVANRSGFGRVVLSKRGAVHTIHNRKGPAKQAAFPAIKAVIEQGIEIYRDKDHDGQGYDTITFSAPITFFGEEAPLAVVVKSFESVNADKTFYIHEICDAEGNYIQMAGENLDKKTSSTNFVEPTSTVSAADDGISPKTNIRNDGEKVKRENLIPGEEGTVFNQNGDPVAHATDDGTIQLSMRTYEEEGRAAFRDYLNKCVKNRKLTKTEMQEMLDGIEEIYTICKDFKDKYAPFSTWSDAAVVRDTYGKPVFSVVTPNGDYKMNLDFSLVCKKRRTLDAVFNEMTKRGIIDNFELGQKSVVKINEIIRRYGMETACALCFVDAKRFRQASMADQFTSLYNELVLSLVPEEQRSSIDHFNFSGYETIKKVEGGIDTWDNSKLDFSHLDHVMKTYGDGTVEYKAAKYIKTHAEGRKLLLRGDFMSSKGFDAVKTQNQDVLKLYNSKKGTGGPKAAFGDVQYMNEVIQKARWWTPKKAYEVGGVRIQSFSDYVPRMVFDYVQMIYDMAATKLPAHAYTKEALFVKQFGLTGVKINMSLIPAIAEGGVAPGLDADGNYVWAGESFDFETAKQIQNAEGYTENCGTICVGVSKQHILKLLSDPDIRMVIPYHKSGLNPIVAHMNKIAAFTDYTSLKTNPGGCQSTIDKNGSKVEVDFNFNEVLRKTGDPKATVQQYLNWCAKNEYTPRFAEFAWHENYYKLIEDFTLFDKDGNYVPQRAVKAVFPNESSAFGSMKDLIKEGLEEDAIVEGKRDSSLSAIVDEIEQTIPKTEAEIPEEQVEQADRDLEADVMLSDRDTDGNQLTEDQQEFFENSKARDENGNLYVMYHGSRSDLFTEFDMYEGVWMTPDQRYAEVYAEQWRSWRGDSENLTGLEQSVYADPDYRVYKMYANITNPLDLGEINEEFDRSQMNRLAKLLGVPASRIRNISHHDGYQTVGFVYEVTKDHQFIEIAKEKGYDGFVATEKGRKTFCAFNAPNQVKLTTNEVPSGFYDIRYSERDTESVSNRSLLANAFEGVAQNDIERNKIQEYKSKISLIEAEERKLRELTQKIKDLSFAKGPKDAKAIRGLQFEANQTANRINTYDKQLLRLEASKPLQDILAREKKKAYQRAEKKGKEALEAYREKANKTQRELIDRWQESRKKGIESREKTAMRHKIKDIVNELNQYLLKGTKDRHVPIELQKAVAEALDAVNMDTVGADERIAKLQEELMKAKTPEKIQEISRKIDHIREMGDRMNGRLKKLKDAYDEFVNSDDPMIANSHDDVISGKLQSVIESVGDTPLRDMTIAQLEDVYDMYRMVLTTIRNTNKAFKAAKSESISVIANRVMEEVQKTGGKKQLSRKGTEGIKNFFWNNLKPVYAFAHIGSDAFTEVFNNVRAGEDTWALDVTEAREFYLDKSKNHGYNSWDFKKRFNFQSTSGMNFSLDLEQIMSLYAYSKREQAAEHLKKGGIVIDETTEITIKNKLGIPVKFNPTEATAYNISDETLADIISKLTDDQKRFVDEMQEYLSTVMGAKGNEVSLEMYGIKLFKEKNYFPLKSAHQFMAKAKEQQKGEVKIKNSGFSKETVQKASNPIVLTPFMNVWADHVNEMSMYHAFVLPMEDFYRVYNYRTPTSDTMATESVEMFIQNAYGKGATKYIDQLLKDLNGGARTDSTTGFINKMMGLFKKGSVFASLSVTIQQPSAIARATALVDIKHFFGPRVDRKRHKALWDEVKQYAPVAIIKEMGYFDTNMGKSTQDFILGKEYSGIGEKMKALVTDSGYRDEVLSKAPALADELAWCSIWEAVKRETKSKNPGMDVKSEAFLQKAGERFTEVIVKTQVYDSVLSRSGNMRSKDTGMKMATAFMAEPTTSINMIADALLQGKRGNGKYARAAIGSVIAAQIFNSILVSFVYAGRDDDEDKTYWEKYIGTFTGEVLDGLNPATYIPFIKDIVSIVQGYDVERSDMSVISDLWKAYENLSKDYISPYRKVEGFVGSIAQIFGLPVKNIMRDARAINQTIMSFMSGQQTTKAGIVYAVKETLPAWLGGGETNNQQQLYEAILSGDKEQIARAQGRYDDQTAINTAIRKALRENDSRIRAAAEAKVSGDLDEYMRLAREIIKEGYFSQDNVVAAINAEINALSKEETSTSSNKASGMFKADDFALAISQGDNAMANAIKQDIIQTAQKNGKTAEEAEKSFKSSAKSSCRELFMEGQITEKQAINALVTYCGYDREDAEEIVSEWGFEADYGFKWDDRSDAYMSGQISKSELITMLIDIGGKTQEEAELQVQVYDWEAQGYEGATVAAVRNYNEYCASVNVPKDVYLHIRSFANNTENDVDANGKTINYSAMKKIMAEIGAQRGLTAAQKTAIARSLGWAEKNIQKYKTW